MPTIEIHLDDQSVSSVPFEGQRLVIGRADGTDIQLPERDVSRQHAAFLRRDRIVLVQDLGSRYGTFVNDERLLYDDPYPLEPGDIVSVGSYRIAVSDIDSPNSLAEAKTDPNVEGAVLELESTMGDDEPVEWIEEPAPAPLATVPAAVESIPAPMATHVAPAPAPIHEFDALDDLDDLDTPRRRGGIWSFLLLLFFLGVSGGLIYAYFNFFQVSH